MKTVEKKKASQPLITDIRFRTQNNVVVKDGEEETNIEPTTAQAQESGPNDTQRNEKKSAATKDKRREQQEIENDKCFDPDKNAKMKEKTKPDPLSKDNEPSPNNSSK